MASFDDSFEALVAATQDQYEKASSNWMPDPGEYTCLMTNLTTEVRCDPQTNQSYFQIQPIWEIIGHPTLAGNTFRGDRLTNKSLGALGITKDFVSKAIGTPTGNLLEDIKLLAGLEGRLVVRLKLVKSRDGQFTNARLDEVEQTLPAEEAAAA